MNSECWIFSGETIDTFGEFIQVILVERKMIKVMEFRLLKSLKDTFKPVFIYLVGRLHCHGNDRLWDVYRLLWDK